MNWAYFGCRELRSNGPIFSLYSPSSSIISSYASIPILILSHSLFSSILFSWNFLLLSSLLFKNCCICWGCQSGVAPLVGGNVTSLLWFVHLWSPPGTQLSHVAPHSCFHATVATPQAMASNGQQNHVMVANGAETLSKLGLAYLCIWRLDLVDSAEETFMVQWRGRWLQQCPVECREQVEACKDFLVIHCTWSISWHFDLVLPLYTGDLGWESVVDGAQLFLTLNKVIVQVTSHPSSLHPIMCNRCTINWQVWIHWQS